MKEFFTSQKHFVQSCIEGTPTGNFYTSVCVCEIERERERERYNTHACVCVCVCVCVRERESVCVLLDFPTCLKPESPHPIQEGEVEEPLVRRGMR